MKPIQFGLRRLLMLMGVAALCSTLFAILYWPRAVVVFILLNTMATVYFSITAHKRAATLCAATAVLSIAALIFTDWGMSSLRRQVHLAWFWVVAAAVSQLAVMMEVLFQGLPGDSDD